MKLKNILMALTLFFSIILFACTSASQIILSNGSNGFVVSCWDKKECYKKARQVCSGNYIILESTAINDGFTRHHQTIQCAVK